MKIRIKGNFVRYRLSKTEVTEFCEKGYLEEKTVFPSKTFVYALMAKEGIAHLEAAFEGDKITLYVPKSKSADWAQSNRVGFEHNLFPEDHNSLSLLLEKDFTCLDNTLEDQSDNYPNPRAPR